MQIGRLTWRDVYEVERSRQSQVVAAFLLLLQFDNFRQRAIPLPKLLRASPLRKSRGSNITNSKRVPPHSFFRRMVYTGTGGSSDVIIMLPYSSGEIHSSTELFHHTFRLITAVLSEMAFDRPCWELSGLFSDWYGQVPCRRTGIASFGLQTYDRLLKARAVSALRGCEGADL